jgi:hypothetical protein
MPKTAKAKIWPLRTLGVKISDFIGHDFSPALSIFLTIVDAIESTRMCQKLPKTA